MGIGKLYKSNDEDFAVKVCYRFHDEAPINWWGELILIEYKRINDGNGYIIELDDKRKGTCYLVSRVNQALNGDSPCYIYLFMGTSSMIATALSSKPDNSPPILSPALL